MRIYIIGSPGSGKTYLSEKLSKKYKIKSYELDKVAWDDDNGNIKRTDEEVSKTFKDILIKKDWIIEDVGRDKFKKGREKADKIYYIKISSVKAYLRVTKRWFRQRIGKERYNASPTFNQLGYFYSVINSYFKKEKRILKELEQYKDKLILVNNRNFDKL